VFVTVGIRVGSRGACGAAAEAFAVPAPDVTVVADVGSTLANSARDVSLVALATKAATRATTPTATKRMPMR
jgi:hypothetical protein